MKKKGLTLLKAGITLLLAACCTGLNSPLHAQPRPEAEWVRSGGGKNIDMGAAVSSDRWGNVYYTGFFQGDANFNPGGTGGALTGDGNRNVYIVKHDASGGFVWARSITANQGWAAVATDTSGNVYIAGQFSRTVDFDPAGSGKTITAQVVGGPTGGADAFVLKLDSAGRYLWAGNLGSVLPNWNKVAYDMTVAGGHVYITGVVDHDVFTAKMDATSGNFDWAKVVSGARFSFAYGIAVDDSGNVYTTGAFNSDSMDFDPSPSSSYYLRNFVPNTTYDIFISKLDAGGNFVWAKSIGGHMEDYGRDIAIDNAGNVYVTGYFSTTVDFNPGGTSVLLSSRGLQDAFVYKLRPSGAFVWARHMGGSQSVNPRGIAVDDVSNVYTAGYFDQTADFNPSDAAGDTFNLYTRGGNDIYVSKLDSSGNFAWAMSFGGNSSDRGEGLAVDADRNVYVAGSFSTSGLNFDTRQAPSVLTPIGSSDAFVLKISQVCDDTSSSCQSVTLCEDQYTFNGRIYDSSGVFTQVYPNALGCDSTVTLDLTLNGKVLHPVINVSGFKLSTMTAYATYQWLLNGSIIPGATSRGYDVQQNGDYQVVVSNGKGCDDTSDIYKVTNAGIEDMSRLAGQISIYPNPAKDKVYIDAPVPVRVTLSSIDGRVLKQAANNSNIFSMVGWASGMYLIRVSDQEGRLIKVEKLIRE